MVMVVERKKEMRTGGKKKGRSANDDEATLRQDPAQCLA